MGVHGAESTVWSHGAGGGHRHWVRRHEPHPPGVCPLRGRAQPQTGRVLLQQSRLLLLTRKSTLSTVLKVVIALLNVTTHV